MDDFADRTLPPTDRRRREARLRGETARSRDLSTALLLIAASGSLWFLAAQSLNGFVPPLRQALTRQPPNSLSIPGIAETLSDLARVAAVSSGPILLTIVLAAALGQLIQTGWLWAAARIQPRFQWRPVLAWHSFQAAAFSLAKLSAVGFVLWRFVVVHSPVLRNLGQGETAEMLVQPARIAGEFTFHVAAVLLIISLVDYGLQYWRHELSLRMTVEERRREQREDQRDPRFDPKRLTSRSA